jgi:hypothetical protein
MSDNGNLTIVKYKRSISSTEWQNTTENFEKLRPVKIGVSPLLRTCWWVDPAPSGESGDDLDWQNSTRSWSAKAFGLEPSVVKSVIRLAMWAVVLRRIVSNGPRELHYVVSSALQIHSITVPLTLPRHWQHSRQKVVKNPPLCLWFPRFIASTPSVRRFFGGSPSTFPSRWILEHSRKIAKIYNRAAI